jgi:hypothetical protein
MNNLDIVSRPGRGKAHAVFGFTFNDLVVTYCGQRWASVVSTNRKQAHCKHCTRQLRKAGMSWRWYEVDKPRNEARKGRQEAQP